MLFMRWLLFLFILFSSYDLCEADNVYQKTKSGDSGAIRTLEPRNTERKGNQDLKMSIVFSRLALSFFFWSFLYGCSIFYANLITGPTIQLGYHMESELKFSSMLPEFLPWSAYGADFIHLFNQCGPWSGYDFSQILHYY